MKGLNLKMMGDLLEGSPGLVDVTNSFEESACYNDLCV